MSDNVSSHIVEIHFSAVDDGRFVIGIPNNNVNPAQMLTLGLMLLEHGSSMFTINSFQPERPLITILFESSTSINFTGLITGNVSESQLKLVGWVLEKKFGTIVMNSLMNNQSNVVVPTNTLPPLDINKLKG